MKHLIELRPQEEVVSIVRRHWFVLVGPSIGLFLLGLLLFGVITALVATNIITNEANPGALLLFFLGLLALLLWAVFFAFFTNYYLDTWIITTERILDIEQRAFFVRDVSEFRLDRIQDLTIEIQGLIPTMLDFGTIKVETAGETASFTMKTIPRPVQIQKIISEQMNKVSLHKAHTQTP